MNAGAGSYFSEALKALTKKSPIFDAETRVPADPGLYAIWGIEGVWTVLGLQGFDNRPLYVGKAERSLLSRDVRQHFGGGDTGHSTVRRSFAALLRARLELRGQPRNLKNPGHYASYGLSSEHDAKLTAWMRENLELAVWGWPAANVAGLRALELRVIKQWQPAMNIQHAETPWKARVKAGRKVMAEEASVFR
jgi:hypothetical protein